MADNATFQAVTLATPPSGTVVSADESLTSGLMQRVKLAYSADGVDTHVAADSNGLEVQGAGVAGTAAGGVMTVQGQAGMTAVKVDGSAVTQPVSGTVTADAGLGPWPVTDNGGSLTVDGTITANLAVGTNNIGDVDVLTVPAPLSTSGGGTEATALRVTIANDSTGVVSVDDNGGSLTVDIGAGTALIGQVSASDETSTVYNGTTALTPKFATISASSSGDNSIVAAVTSKKIRVLLWVLVSNGSVNVKWRNGTTDITGLLYLVSNTGVSAGYCPVGHFETSVTTALQLNLSAAIAVGGYVVYVEV